MTVAEAPSLLDAARVARRAVLARRRADRRVPRLRRGDRGPGAEPRVWMICPDWDHPSGGIRKQYRAVDVLNGAGVAAAIVHRRPGFACSWFEHRTRIVAADEVVVGAGDVIAVPEIYGPSILDLPAGIPQVIFNQNAYLTLDSLVADGPGAAAPYVDNPDLAAVVVVSDQNADLLRFALGDLPTRRIRHALDPAVHFPPAAPPRRRIAYMPRRRSHAAAQVLRLLELRGALAGWEVVEIDGLTEPEVADALRASRIFLSLSELEGFGLPPLEALACGCLVVGFDGFAGREFFRPPFAVAVEDGDVVAFARAVEEAIRRCDRDPAAVDAACEAGSRYALGAYSPAVERRDLLDVFAALVRR